MDRQAAVESVFHIVGVPTNPPLSPVTSIALAAALACLPAYSFAQSQPTKEAERVEITASKRKERSSEVAGTVSAIQGGELERRGALDQEDVFKLTPGVQLNKGDPERALPTIRGIGTTSSSTSLGLQQGTTGLYIEDVPFTDPFGFVSTVDLSPFDLERVEILRGPQGALYGSSSLGGAVRYIVNKPDLRSTGFSLLTTLSSISGGGAGYSLQAMGNIPIEKDVSALRVVAFDRKDSGYIRNLGTGKDEANELRQRGGRLIGTIKPTSATTITGMVLTQKTDIDDGFAVSPDPSKLSISTASPSPRSSEFTMGNVQVDVELGQQVFTSNTGYFTKRATQRFDATRIYGGIGALYGPLLGVGALPNLPLVTSPSETKAKSMSQEFRLASKGSSSLSYVVGAFYQKSTYDSSGTIDAPGGQALWGPAGFLLTGDRIAISNNTGDATETALFADGELALGGGFSAGAGGRAYRTKLSYDLKAAFFGGPLNANPDLSQSGFTPKLTLKYKFGENLWYALGAKGYRFGGVNANPPTFSVYKSDSLWNYETGVKLSPSKDLRMDLTAFRLDWKDAQVPAVTPGVPPVIGIANVGKARSQGLEFGLTWRATTAFTLAAAMAYTDAKTTVDFTSNSGAVIPSGSRLPGTARVQSTFKADYAFEGPAGTSGTFGATYARVGSRVFDLTGAASAPGYGTADLRLAFARDKWEATFFVNNAGNSKGITGAAQTTLPGVTSFTDYYLIRPRTVGVSVRYDI